MSDSNEIQNDLESVFKEVESAEMNNTKSINEEVIANIEQTSDEPATEETVNEGEVLEQKEDKTVDAKDLPLTNPRVELTQEVETPRKEEEQDTAVVAMPSLSMSELAASNNSRIVSLLYDNSTTPANEKEMYQLDMLAHSSQGSLFEKSLQREDSKWGQKLESEGKSIRTAKPKFKMPDTGEKVEGAMALHLVDSLLSTGGYVTVPLMHSGIWVELRPPQPEAFIILQEKLAKEKDDFGKQTMGVSFSNNKVYIVNRLMDFIEDHVTDHNIKDGSKYDLRRLIKITDLLPLAAALGYTLYPNGFDYVSPCTGEDNCNHIHRAKLKIINCIWYDHKSFTEQQKKFMVGRIADKKTISEIEKYQEDIEIRSNSLEYEGIKFFFKIPSIEDNIASGLKWFEDINESIMSAFEDKELTRGTIQDYMEQHINLSVVRQYGHFFKTVKFMETDSYTDDSDTIDKLLMRFSNVSELVDKLIISIGKFIDDNTSTIVAIPRFTCPVCHKEQQENIEKHPYLIPIDPVNLFFTLGGQRIQFGSRK